MSTRKPFVSRLGFSAVAIIALALVLIPPSDARAITFGDWAATQTWAASGITPASVIASEQSITSLAGISSYNWMGTPTTTLHLHKNQLNSIESGAFVGLGKVTVLYLHTNQITSIESGDFAGLGSLTTLDLHTNEITSIPSSAFAELGSLKTLYLQTNQITSIESDDFAGLTSLTRLGLEENQITSIESDDFAALGTLTILHLDHNQIASIEPRAFAWLTELKVLDLHDNATLTELNLEGADLSNLVNFDLTGNAALVRVSFRDTVLTQTALATLATGGGAPTCSGIGGLPITELDLSGIDFAAITDLSPLYPMDALTDLGLVDVSSMDADALDDLLDNLDTMQNPSVGGTLYLTQADYDAFNTAGGEKLTMWDAEDGHQVEIIGLGDANADGVVDDKDASILGSHWQQQGGAGWLDGDFSGDGNVNDADAAILAAHWQEGMGEATPNVPEPSTLALTAIGAVVLLMRAGKRRT